MDQALSRFITHLIAERRLAENSVQSYSNDLNQLMSWANRQKITEPQQLTEQVLKRFLHYLRYSVRMSAKSIARKISAIKTFFTFLQRDLGIKNSAKKLITPKQAGRLPVVLSEEEVWRLLAVAAADSTPIGIRNKVMLTLLYVSGMRVSELVLLKLNHLRQEEGVILVEGKGDKERVIPIGHEVVSLLHDYLLYTYPQLIQQATSRANDYLFPTVYGKKIRHITRQSFWILLQGLAKKAGIKKQISPHKLRHSIATHLLQKGANLRLLQLLLGHENLATVQIYTHVDISLLRRIYDERHPRS